MLRSRIIPALLLNEESLVKTIKFKNPKYIGDPVNTVKIFNELEVDELTILDIGVAEMRSLPNISLLEKIASECFMPLSYGGGINSVSQAKELFSLGFEKIIINTAAVENPNLINELANCFGSQSVIVSVDIKKSFFGKTSVWTRSGTKNAKINPIDWCLEMEKKGAGEILLTSIDQEGTWEGFSNDLIKEIASSVHIPLIAHGGAGSVNHIEKTLKACGASAVALGSMVVYQQKDMGVLVNFPDKTIINKFI